MAPASGPDSQRGGAHVTYRTLKTFLHALSLDLFDSGARAAEMLFLNLDVGLVTGTIRSGKGG